MKYVKLLLIVLIFAGAIFGIFSLIGSSGKGSKINPDSPTLLEDLTNGVDNDWNNAEAWDKKVYEKNLSDLNVYQNDLEKLKPGNHATALNYTNEKVCNKLVEFTNKEFSKSNCSPQNIAELKGALDYFMQKNGTIKSSDSRVATVYAKIKLYNDILAFGKKSFSLSPGFDISTGSWNDFGSYKESQLRIRNGYKSNSNYKSLAHISDIKNSLESLEGKLATARTNYVTSLSSAIISSYRNAPRTAEYQSRLQSVYNRYYNNFEDGGKLSDFRRQFNQQVDEAQRPKTNNQSDDYRW